tara:strand:- start:4765 stop:4953 length:189 start_codon:yes stop_codon:yes gene_type:complete
MDDFHFTLKRYKFIIRKLPDGMEEEAKRRAEKWIEDCEGRGKKLDLTHAYSFNFDYYLPKGY